MQTEFDLIIAGAGLSGNCLALALQKSGLSIAIVETQSQRELLESGQGDRALALSAGTVELLKALDIWNGIADKVTPIKHIHVSDQGHFGKTRLSASQQKVEALGYVIVARDLEQHMASLVAKTNICSIYDTRVIGLMAGQNEINVSLKQQGQSVNLLAQLLVGADGGQSTVRKLLEIQQNITEYGQTAIVATIESSLPHQFTAYERFTAFGPLALLPMQGKQSAVVWTRHKEQAQNLLSLSETDFTAEMQSCFGYWLGSLKLVSARRSFPLSLIHSDTMISDRAVIIGNAVHQLHPVAGQGFNLSIRDIAYLAELILDRAKIKADIGAKEMLKEYTQKREFDHTKTIVFTNQIVNLFSNDFFPVTALRNTGLTLLDHLPGLKKMLGKHAMGMAEKLPKLLIE